MPENSSAFEPAQANPDDAVERLRAGGRRIEKEIGGSVDELLACAKREHVRAELLRLHGQGFSFPQAAEALGGVSLPEALAALGEHLDFPGDFPGGDGHRRHRPAPGTEAVTPAKPDEQSIPDRPPWDVPNLPDRLKRLAGVLDGKGLISSREVKQLVDEYPSDILADYNSGRWAHWVERWIEHDSRAKTCRLLSGDCPEGSGETPDD